MDSGEIKQHLDTIVGNIASIRSLSRQINFEDFRQNEKMRRNIYEYLQEIGNAAHELRSSRTKLKPDFALETLASFRSARHDKEAEIQHQNVWNLIELDLPVIGQEIEQSALYSGEQGRKKVEEKES